MNDLDRRFIRQIFKIGKMNDIEGLPCRKLMKNLASKRIDKVIAPNGEITLIPRNIIVETSVSGVISASTEFDKEYYSKRSWVLTLINKDYRPIPYQYSDKETVDDYVKITDKNVLIERFIYFIANCRYMKIIFDKKFHISSIYVVVCTKDENHRVDGSSTIFMYEPHDCFYNELIYRDKCDLLDI